MSTTKQAPAGKAQVFRNYINGQWVASSAGRTFASVNPADKSVLGHFQQSTAADAKAAVDAARDAFHAWSSFPAPRRGEILFKVAEILKQRKQELGKTVTLEMGKVLPEGLGDVQEAIDVAEYMAGEGRRLFGVTTKSELRDKFCMTIRRPIGVVGLITPWNFPMAIPAWKVMAALICGNTVVWKPSSDTPLCALRLVEACEQAGVPKGVLNFVTGPGGEVGESIVKHPDVRAISFTGHKDTGKRILELSAPQVKRVGLELGSKNAIIVMPDADLKLAVDGILWGGYGTTGQRCTAASRVIVHTDVKDALERQLLDRVRKLRVGSGLVATTDMGPMVNEGSVRKTHEYCQVGQQEGARLLHGGKPMPELPGFYHQPTLFTDVTKDMRIAREEIFGPVVGILPASSFDEIISICNSVDYGLVNSVYTKDITAAFRVIERVETGITYVNASTIGAEVHLPFGGVKQSGNGAREGGIEGINEFSETKAVYIDYSGRLQKAQIETAEYKD